jgi:CheY-like chemotaxis protein
MAKPEEKTILVVDDEPDIVLFLETALDDAGFQVVTAGDGQEALARLGEQAPDLISLDLVMPKKSGIRFMRELQRNPEWARIPILIVTGHARDDLGQKDLQEMLADTTISGPETYLEKPLRPEAFIAAVCRILDVELAEPAEPSADDLRATLQQLAGGADEKALRAALGALRDRSS